MKDISILFNKINAIEGVTLNEVQLNYNQENRIRIKVENPNDYIKWDYFCYKLNRLKKGIKVMPRYPEIIFGFSKDRDKYEDQMVEFETAIDRKYYTLERPMAEHLTIIAKITNLCNLDCQYCYDKPFRDKLGHNGVLPVKDVDRMIELASKYAEHVTIIWHGGEPTLAGVDYYREIYDTVLPKYPYCEFEISIQTNGTLLDKEWFDFSKQYDMGIGSSYNATEEELRETKENNALGSKDKTINVVLDNIFLARESGVDIAVIDVLTKINHKNVINIYEFYKAKGVNVSFNEIVNAGEAVNHDFLYSNEEEFEEYERTTMEYFEYWLKDKEAKFEDRYASKYMKMLLSGDCCVCEHSNCCVRHYIGINSNGDIYPCDRPLQPKYRAGNIQDFNNFYEIYETPEYATFENERHQKFVDKCYDCDIVEYCQGGCSLIDIDIHGTAAIANAYACKMRHINLRAAYNALKLVTFDEVNPIMQQYLIKKTAILPKEIEGLMEELKISDKLKEMPLKDNDNIFRSIEFGIFKTFNPPLPERYIFGFDFENEKKPLKNIEDNRLEKIKDAMHIISKEIEEQYI